MIDQSTDWFSFSFQFDILLRQENINQQNGVGRYRHISSIFVKEDSSKCIAFLFPFDEEQ
jgi:hypothetical protein